MLRLPLKIWNVKKKYTHATSSMVDLLVSLRPTMVTHIPNINGMYVVSLGVKIVRKTIICWRINERSDIHGWEVKLMLFNAMVTQVLLYGVEG